MTEPRNSGTAKSGKLPCILGGCGVAGLLLVVLVAVLAWSLLPPFVRGSDRISDLPVRSDWNCC
jgi:hypothetical protein